jgi:hypothetical protein
VLSFSPQPWEDSLHARMVGAPINEDVLLELFDRVGPAVWGYSLHRSRGRRQARQVAINAFLTAAQHPAVFADRRVPIRLRMLMLVHLETEALQAADRSAGARWPRLRRGRGRDERSGHDEPRPDLTLV